MEIFHTLDQITPSEHLAIITIGNFDGLHLGHASVIEEVIRQASHAHQESILLTFNNHPLEILKPHIKILKLLTPAHKITVLQKSHLSKIFILEFTKIFSEQSAEGFLKNIYRKIPFSKLILGPDATFGKAREGNQARVMQLAKEMGFEAIYLEPLQIDNEILSSSKIRHLIQEGNFVKAKKFLGRDWSIYSKVIPGLSRGKQIGFATANIDVQGLCLPPLGVYAVKIIIDNQSYLGVANLGFAPTIRTNKFICLEVYILNFNQNLYGKNIEIIPMQFIRKEIHFDSVQALKSQIDKDVIFTQSLENLIK